MATKPKIKQSYGQRICVTCDDSFEALAFNSERCTECSRQDLHKRICLRCSKVAALKIRTSFCKPCLVEVRKANMAGQQEYQIKLPKAVENCAACPGKFYPTYSGQTVCPFCKKKES